ncbi:DUF5107 domain-containing protein [Granulicella rosea]|uniref:DUF5107 domain-containing protein n=1 Tax=Granulicella rosea TaxID=474952 RepID=UPI001FE9822A|nr:DUF5107 domain-containing protein [Granulicella rosea]
MKAWEEPVTMMTYEPAPAEVYPLFLEQRVYQGSSGRIYPLPVIDRIETEARPRAWKAVHLENEFIRLMVLPEIGGRIHVGLDKRNGYDFFYRQNVIKPALVGLAGPWISGGVEFNWPQHHRPATFMPVEVAIERDEDGSVTVWCSDHDPMTRMKGMHGICLRPGRAYVEVCVRLYNRTEDTQSFLWWANVATRVHERYQSFFPQDVRFAADHAKRAITEYPLSQGTYYGIDYERRAHEGVPEEESPSCFVPDGSYAPNDLGWYANIPVPTSYMIVGSSGDFFGGYDHARRAGTVAYANHHISPGKKQWTWGNHEFGYAWDRSLTDADGPYIELMSGVYTDNQPDFSFLAPGETKTFSQYWYPIGEIGVPNLANLDAALRVERSESSVRVHLQVTSARDHGTLIVRADGKELGRWIGALHPEEPLTQVFETAGAVGALEVLLEAGSVELIRYAPDELVPVEMPEVATEPELPEDIESLDELYLNGLHLEQYRHPTRSPEAYWLEALCRDAGDSRCNHALGRWHMRRGEFKQAERYLRLALARLTARNPNSYDGEPSYNLGMTLLYQDKLADAYGAFYKCTWNAAWRGPGFLRLAEIDCRRGDWRTALDHLDQSLRVDADNLKARNLKAMVLRRLGRSAAAEALIAETRRLDALDSFSRYLEGKEVPADGQMRLDLGLDLMGAGFLEDAIAILSAPSSSARDGATTMLLYAEASARELAGQEHESRAAYRKAADASTDYVFPSRLTEMLLLQKAIAVSPADPYAPYYLANLLYDRRRYEQAIALWERTTELAPKFPIAWRNLGFAYFNVLQDADRARQAFERARELAPQDARLLYEYDQLLKRTGAMPEARRSMLEEHRAAVDRRDDLSVELASLYNGLGQPQRALAILLARHFQPWEGGEGLVLSEYVRAHVLLAQMALKENDFVASLEHLHAASNPPRQLSEAKHLLMNLSQIDYWLGETYARRGDAAQANASWSRAARQRGDFQQMQVQTVSEMTYWSALALRSLGREDEASELFLLMREQAGYLRTTPAKIDYFATSLPAMLLFDEDLDQRRLVEALFLEAQARLGSGDLEAANRLLHEVQRLNRNHAGASDLLHAEGANVCTGR